VVAIVVGVGVTVVSAILPARRAVRIAPVAALVEDGGEAGETVRRRRVTAGVAVAALGVVAVVAGLAKPTVALVGLGAVLVFIAAAMLVPVVARPLSSALGRPLAALLGMPGKLGRENSMRNPRRTAQTAAALMIGLALVSTIAVLGASLSTSAKNSVDSAVSADYIVSGSGGFSKSVAPTVSRLPGVTTTTTIYQGQFEFKNSLSTLVAATPANLSRTVTLHVTSGSGASAMAASQLLIDTNTARANGLHVGSVVPVKFAQTGSSTMTIGGIYKPNPLVGSFVVGDGFFLSHFDNPLPIGVLLSTAPGTPDLGPALNRVLTPYANVGYKTRAQFEQSQQDKINQELGLVYVLLALAVLVALIGIVNTLMLSVFERTREIGLLRAVGMKRRQVRAMIRSESVIVALFGAVVGIVIGACLGVALASSLRQNGVTNIALPIPSLIAFVILAGVLGLIAATWPARRAANLDVLAAIAAE
jgi:putative ABC transport system permease protein